jgi:hypothetical protein
MTDEHELGRMVRMLPAAPAAWVEAAQALPFLKDELDSILARAEGDPRFRKALRDDANEALHNEGYDLSPSVVAHLMRKLPPEHGSAS